MTENVDKSQNILVICNAEVAAFFVFFDISRVYNDNYFRLILQFKYLQLKGAVGNDTFGYDRYLNQILYNSPEWKRLRNQIIIRDNGRDLGCEGYEIYGRILIHHMNPITVEDIVAEIESANHLLKIIRKNRNKQDIVLGAMLNLLEDNAVIISGIDNAGQVAEDIRALIRVNCDIPQELVDYWLLTLNGVVSRARLAVNQIDTEIIEVSHT